LAEVIGFIIDQISFWVSGVSHAADGVAASLIEKQTDDSNKLIRIAIQKTKKMRSIK
jgi:hypothetical protein